MARRPSLVLALGLGASTVGATALGCNALWGVDALSYGAGGGGTGPSGGGQGGAGAQGGGTSCSSGSTRSCYDGPANTANQGVCQPGQQTCTHGEWGPCQGQVLPTSEICGNALDEDCDGHVASGTDCLVDDGLLVRYLIDEAATGQAPTELHDSAAAPLALPIQYASGVAFCAPAGHRGLCGPSGWTTAVAGTLIDNTKLQLGLNGATKLTIELVVDLTGSPPNTAVRATGIGTPVSSGGADVAVGARSWGDAYFVWSAGTKIVNWPIGTFTLGRAVLHVVVDSTQPVATDRVRLFVGGVPATASTDPMPAQNEALPILTGNAFTIGNAMDGARAVQGTIFYVAWYASALDSQQVATNATLLAVSDDTTP